MLIIQITQTKYIFALAAFWERQSHTCHFLSPTQQYKNRLWAQIIPYQEIESTELVLDSSPSVGISFSFSDSVCITLFCSSMYIIQHLVKLTAIALFCGERVGGLLLQHKRDVYRPIALCQLPKRPAGHGETTPITEAELFMFLLYVR